MCCGHVFWADISENLMCGSVVKDAVASDKPQYSKKCKTIFAQFLYECLCNCVASRCPVRTLHVWKWPQVQLQMVHCPFSTNMLSIMSLEPQLLHLRLQMNLVQPKKGDSGPQRSHQNCQKVPSSWHMSDDYSNLVALMRPTKAHCAVLKKSFTRLPWDYSKGCC